MNAYFAEVTIAKPGDLGGGHWKLTNLSGLTVLFGKNGSGKSRLLRAWRDTDAKTCHYIIPERVGDLSYEASYLQHQIDGSQRKGQSEHNFSADYRRHIITRIQAYFLTRGSVREDQLPGDPAELEGYLSSLLPDFTLVLTGTANPPYELLRAQSNAKIKNIHQLSSGEAQLLTVALDVLTIAAMWDIQGNDNRLMLIDEPDAHIHPDLQVRFADFLVKVAQRFKLQGSKGSRYSRTRGSDHPDSRSEECALDDPRSKGNRRKAA
jgi:hypothetical protein